MQSEFRFDEPIFGGKQGHTLILQFCYMIYRVVKSCFVKIVNQVVVLPFLRNDFSSF